MKKLPIMKHKRMITVISMLFFSCFALLLCSCGGSPFSTSLAEGERYYYVTVYIDFNDNLFMAKYDIDFYVDGTLKQRIEHGNDPSYALLLSNVEHTFVFAEAGSSSNYTEVKLVVMQNISVTYGIKTHIGSIDVWCSSLTAESATENDDWYDREYELLNNAFYEDSNIVEIIIENFGFTARTISIQGSITVEADVSSMEFSFCDEASLYYDADLGVQKHIKINQANKESVMSKRGSETSFSLTYLFPADVIDCIGVYGFEIPVRADIAIGSESMTAEINFSLGLEFAYR